MGRLVRHKSFCFPQKGHWLFVVVVVVFAVVVGVRSRKIRLAYFFTI